MAKYCGKCGSKLDEATGLCPNCNADKLQKDSTPSQLSEVPEQVQADRGTSEKSLSGKDLKKRSKSERRTQKEVTRREKREQWSTGKKVRRFILKLILIFLLLIVLVIGTAGALVYFEVVDLPTVSYILERSGFDKKEDISINPLVDNYIPDENTIAFDEETNLFYANNEIIVIFSIDATDAQKEDVISYLNGELAGTIPELNMYQIIVPSCDTLEEIIHISDDVMLKFNYIIYATYDTATINPDDAYAPNDPWNGDVTEEDWEDSSVDGSNWWIEAIDAQNAWNFQDNFSEITIGICDSSFDTGHEDLKNRVQFPNEILESRNIVTPWWNDFNNKTWSVSDQENCHGTHVVGIIGAEGDNKKGITGIVQNCKLLLAPYYRSDGIDAYLAWDSSTYANLSYLVKAGAKVINFSQGKTNLLLEGASHIAYSEEIIEREGNLASICIAQLIDSGYKNFIVIQSAGNGTGDTGKALDAIQNGWFASITNNSVTGYDDIPIDEVRSRVIIVGAAEQTSSGFQCASFSNFGSQVNVCAPGVEIYSTVPGEVFYDFQFAGGYNYMSGTSMSAPIVTGVCALTWSANPSLSPGEVKDIVCNNSHIEVSANPENENSLSYNLVNAKLSVEAALNYLPEQNEEDNDYFTANPVELYNQALAKLDGTDLSITKEGSFFADFVNFSELQFTQNMDIQGFGEPTMTASGHYTSTGGSSDGTSEMDYDFTYDSQGTHIPNYEQPVTGELVTLELPHLECVHSYSETEGDENGKTYLITYDGDALTEENCGIFSSVLTSPFSIYWSSYGDEDGIQEANVLFSLDGDGNLTSIEVTYELIAGIQGIASTQGKTSFVLGESNANHSPTQTQIPDDAVVSKNHSYYVYDLDSVTTWEEAEEYCESLGGHLATITSREEDDFLFDYVSNLGYGSVLFGLSDANQEGSWVWVTGEALVYENWASGEPNNQGGYEHYGQYYEKNTDGTWNDGSGKTCPFLCEWDERKPQSETTGAGSRWSEFISSGEYTEFTSQMRDYEGNQLESQYALLDIDGDGWEEMVLYALSDGVGFGFHAVLSCDKTTGTISFVPIETDMTDGTTGYSNIVQDFRGVSYSIKNHALCYRTMNNGMMFGSTGFWVLKDGQINCDFSVGFDQPQEYWDAWPESASSPQDPIYYISNDNGRIEISKEEYDDFIITEPTPIDWRSFP